jgi:hypothetical protein
VDKPYNWSQTASPYRLREKAKALRAAHDREPPCAAATCLEAAADYIEHLERRIYPAPTIWPDRNND